MTLRFLALIFWAAAFALPGCDLVPDDDDTAVDDDDAGDDDDAAPVDPCEAPEDISADVTAGESVSGGTNNEDDNFRGSCDDSGFGSNDAIFVFTPETTGTYFVSTSDPSTDFDTVLVAFTDCEEPEATEIGCADDVNTDAEILTSEMEIEAVAGEPVFIVVDGYEEVGHYELLITPTICGDGLVAGGEMCDDGNTDPNDGCDASCIWECVDDAAEDDDTLATATELALPGEVDGMLCPTDEGEVQGFYDMWAVDLTVGEYATADASPTGGGSCESLVLGLAFFDDQGNILSAPQSDDDCPIVTMEAPVTGRYYLSAGGTDVRVPPQDYTLNVVAGFSECGNGTVEGLEECDDGNHDSNDGCADICVTEDPTCTVVGPVTLAANVSGDTDGAADDHVSSCFIVDGEGGEDVVYQFDSAADQTVIVTTAMPGTDEDTDTVVYVREQCRAGVTEIACNDDFNDDNYFSELGFRASAGETYFIIVDAWAADGGVFELGLSLATCGDGVVEPGEECDDGNVEPADGCEPDCTETPAAP
jgi:cysteine-rich repeat protein